ncbi:MAG: nucleotidyl transferase AbiEii/AbiGii toxin family protein [Bacilli bacterium]|nr:nucleotidyl transferase AbiEii/AbiGii toxin family protein [Bacilli bacterium]
MKLYENKALFTKYIQDTSKYFGIPSSIIEKDYYVSELLKTLANRCSNLIFKGSTSLSKCHHLIKRFSEDIDLSLTSKTIGNKRNLKHKLLDSCEHLNLKITNINDIKSHMNFNRYKIAYPIIYPLDIVTPMILVETTFITSSEPYEEKECSSLIAQYLKKTRQLDILNKYCLDALRIKVQSIEKTFVDKVFAICDFYLKNNITRNSRHVYDLYMLYPKIKFDSKMKKIISDSYTERKLLKSSPSAKDGMSVNKLLQEIIDKNVYKNDFRNITRYMIYEALPYEKAITVINKIIKLNLFK